MKSQKKAEHKQLLHRLAFEGYSLKAIKAVIDEVIEEHKEEHNERVAEYWMGRGAK